MDAHVALFFMCERLTVSEFVEDLLCSRDGDRKSHAFDQVRSELDRIDTDDFAADVYECAAAVTGIDGRIGLDEDHLGTVDCNFTVFGAYITDCGRLAVAHGVADGDRHLADLDIIRAAELGNRDGVDKIFVKC